MFIFSCTKVLCPLSCISSQLTVVILEARWSKFLSGKSCSGEKSWPKAHMVKSHFKRENDI
jgi:hypothetical protein